MSDLIYASSVALECLVQQPINVRASSVSLECLAQNRAPARASSVHAEVLSHVESIVNCSAVFLEVLCQNLTYAAYVPDGCPTWTLRPNWGDGVTERLKWMTDVTSSQTGVEQRRAIRISPRREIEAKYTLIRNRRRILDSYMSGPQASLWRVPLWWEERRLYAAASSGDHYLSINTSSWECFSGDYILIMGRDPLIYEVVNVHENPSDGTPLWLQNSLQKSWPVGTSVFPLRTCYITGTQSTSRKADDAAEVTITFETAQANDYPAIVPAMQLGDGNYANQWKPDYGEDVTLEYQRILAEWDNDQGIIVRRDVALRSFRVLQLAYTFFNAGDHTAFRGFLYWLQGKLKPIYVQTNMRDLEIVAPSIATDTTITIKAMDYAYFGGQTNEGRSMILIQFANGTYLYVSVTASLDNGNGTETLTLAQTLGTEVTSALVRRISFVELMRSDQDEIELLHHTDAQGATSVKMTFRSLQTGRVADDYTPQSAFTGSYTEDPDPPTIPIQQPMVAAATTTDTQGFDLPSNEGGLGGVGVNAAGGPDDQSEADDGGADDSGTGGGAAP